MRVTSITFVFEIIDFGLIESALQNPKCCHLLYATVEIKPFKKYACGFATRKLR